MMTSLVALLNPIDEKRERTLCRIGELVGLAHDKPVKGELALEPQVPAARHGRKGHLIGVRRERGEGRFSFAGLDLELKLHMAHARGLECVPDQRKVVFHHPVLGKPVGAGQDHGALGRLKA